MSIVIELKDRKHLRCTDVPGTVRCTDRLYDGNCPAKKDGICSSSKFNSKEHSRALPKFFREQH